MTIYFTDKVQITPVIRDTNFRTETDGQSFKSEASVETDDRIVYGADGQPVKPARRIFLPYGININEGDKIKIVEKNNRIIENDKNRIVKSVDFVGSFEGDHLEVIS